MSVLISQLWARNVTVNKKLILAWIHKKNNNLNCSLIKNKFQTWTSSQRWINAIVRNYWQHFLRFGSILLSCLQNEIKWNENDRNTTTSNFCQQKHKQTLFEPQDVFRMGNFDAHLHELNGHKPTTKIHTHKIIKKQNKQKHPQTQLTHRTLLSFWNELLFVKFV